MWKKTIGFLALGGLGALFSSAMGTSSSSDLEAYRSHYPSLPSLEDEDKTDRANLDFYQGRQTAVPDGIGVDEMIASWRGQYDLLEGKHGYVQWLFPIREHGMNPYAQPLQQFEAKAMREDPLVMERFMKAYDLMLDFYGIEVISPPTSKGKGKETKSSVPIEPSGMQHQRRARLYGRPQGESWETRYDNLAYSTHNHLRITRVLKCLGELGLEEYKVGLLQHLREEIFVNGVLPHCHRSYSDYWVQTIYDDAVREALAE